MAVADGRGGWPPRAFAVDGRPLPRMADSQPQGADRIGHPLPRVVDGQVWGWTGLFVRHLGSGRSKLGGGRPIDGLVCLILPHLHLLLTTSDVL